MRRTAKNGSAKPAVVVGAAIIVALAAAPRLFPIHQPASASHAAPATAAQLAGQWEHGAGCLLTITPMPHDPSRLLLKYSASRESRDCLVPEGTQLEMAARFVGGNGRALLDVSPRNHRQMFSPAIHSVFVVAFDGDRLLLIPPSAGWLRQAGPDRVTAAMKLEAGNIPAWSGRDVSAAELQRFALAHLDDGFFNAPPWQFARIIH